MINKQWRRLAVSLLVMSCGTMPVRALEGQETRIIEAEDYLTPQGTAGFGQGDAAITITPNNSQSLIGKQFYVYQLFDAENSTNGESINYTLNEKYSVSLQAVVAKALNKAADSVTEYEIIDYMQSLNSHLEEGANNEQILEGRYSDYRYFVETLRNQLVLDGIDAPVVTVTEVKTDGSFIIGGLAYGYYLVDEISTAEDQHSAASLCIMNTANPHATVQIKSDYPDIIKKIKEDDNDIGWNDIGDFEIGQTVPYKYEATVPNMNGYDDYYYAFHDVMDQALTFHPESVTIEISDADKTYILTADEMNIVENPSDDHTFDIIIDDLKQIIDREFPKINENRENTYDQHILLTYDATLNDLAADDTGRPGFENDVQLEFSNNPDSDGKGETGRTPWDTVVCFTYRLDGLKVNNHKAPLADAKFRLYSDEACEQEVFVKKMTDGTYHIINRDTDCGNDAVEMVSDDNGVFTIIGLDSQCYWLKETDSPAGYRELLDPIKLSITATFTPKRQDYIKGEGATEKTLQELSVQADFKEFLGGIFTTAQSHELAVDEDEGSMHVTVINTAGSKLPITGSNGTILLLGAGIAMMAMATIHLKREKHHD